MKVASIPLWLDKATAALLEETVSMLIKRHGNILLAVILFGSVARHEERPLDDPCPSDVDVLAIFDTTDRLVKPYRETIFATIVDACALHLDAPRDVNVLLSERTMQSWDSMFLDNIARDGILLYARGPLPAQLAARQALQGRVEEKGLSTRQQLL
jgi:predicted nucleotidyltransferase